MPPALKTLFIHIPKCGGTSAFAFLAYAYPIQRALHAIGKGYVEGSIDLEDLYEIPYDELVERWDFITGHIPYQKARQLGGDRIFSDYAAVTVLRHPLDRARSVYSFARKNPHYSGGHTIYERPFKEYLEALIDDPDSMSDMAFFATGEREKQRAIAVLQRDFVAAPPLDDLPDFLRGYYDRVGGERAYALLHENATGPVDFDTSISDDLRANFLAACETDLAVYEWSKANWRSHMAAKLDERLGPAS